MKNAKSSVQNYFRFVRNIYGEDLLENFLVSAVASVLLIRLFLGITNYPQLSGAGLHFAHMLWGGLLMLIGMFMALGFLSHPAHEWAAVIGGLGFGAFIDELGKFITQNNDYFFQPTVAIIYVLFILIYLAIRGLFNYRALFRHERLANAFEIMKQGSINSLTLEDEQVLTGLLNEVDPANPLAQKLKEMLPYMRFSSSQKGHFLDRFKRYVDKYYEYGLRRWWFPGVVVAFFAFFAVTGFSAAIGIISFPWNWILGTAASMIIVLSLLQLWVSKIPNLQIPLSAGVVVCALAAAWIVFINPNDLSLPFAVWGQFSSSSISAILIITGIVFMARSRLIAYQMFHRAILVSLLLTMVFAFYQYQFYALTGFFLNLLILFALRYMINHEKIKRTNGEKS